MITETQAKMITHVLHEIRPGWGIEGTFKVFQRNKDHTSPFADNRQRIAAWRASKKADKPDPT